MVFYMPGGPSEPRLEPQSAAPQGDALTPQEIVAQLDRYIVGQHAAKRAVAVALRNRWRRRQLSQALAPEITPKNILLIGPTGVGKTEVARRLARLAGCPFIKVEATKYTEVGYVGRDCESMIRDLVEAAIVEVRRERQQQVAAAAGRAVEDRLLDALAASAAPTGSIESAADRALERESLRARLRAGELDDRQVEIELKAEAPAAFKIGGAAGGEDIDVRLGEMLPGMFGGRTRRRRVSVREARELLQRDEEDRRLDQEELARIAVQRAEQSGIVFIDEIDKIAVRSGNATGPDVSRQGVQRDLLPIVEGTTVRTKHGVVATDHILFIAAGAFHIAKPSDLIPELQGRFPIRVELERLSEFDLLRILTEPEGSLIRQYRALLSVDGVDLTFTSEALAQIARLADRTNRELEDIGARRLATILERLLEPILFDAPHSVSPQVEIGGERVQQAFPEAETTHDLSRFML
jgi:ATP-dependent HslUV protease ATP-binding subunit HslU